MAMFDLEDVGKAKLDDNKTTDPTLVKGRRIDNFEASANTSGVPAAETLDAPESTAEKIKSYLVNHAISFLFALAATIFGGLAVWWLTR